jgi:predicted transcriptional regulator
MEYLLYKCYCIFSLNLDMSKQVYIFWASNISEEKEEWINGLAEIYHEQGYKISAHTHVGQPINEIVNKIAEVTGLTEKTVRTYLQGAYKQKKEGGIEANT